MLKKLYEPFMAFLALAVLALLVIDLSYQLDERTLKVIEYIDNAVLIIFAADYFTRLYLAKDKWKFFKENIFDLIAIIPFNSVFRAARLTRLLRFARLIKVLRLSVYLARFLKRFDKFFKTNNFYRVLIVTLIIVISGSALIALVEDMSFSDSLWWSFVTATTVGYGDISPKTGIGRIIAVTLMITGIGFIGMLTGTISTYFIKKTIDKKDSYRDEVIDGIKQKLDDIDNLTYEDIEYIRNVLLAIKVGTSDSQANYAREVEQLEKQNC